MNENINLFKVNETLSYRFYQMPKELFRNPLYKDKLSLEAKVTYSLLLDRMELSRINRWFNEKGEIFLQYTRVELVDELKISRVTAAKVFKELIDTKLIVEERLGQGYPNRIYIGKMQVEDLEKFKDRNFRSKETLLLEVKNRISRSKKENTNDTDIIETENIYSKDDKIFYTEKVSMYEKEVEELVKRYGEDKTAKFIVSLDLYKKSSGKEYASDFDAIQSWVISKIEREELREKYNKTKPSIKYKSYSQREYDDLESYYDNL